MEILMKLKCSPTPAHSPHLHKSVDRLQQQHQQQSSSPLQQYQYQTKKQQQQQQQNDSTYQQRLNCMDYNTTTNAANINCCSTLNQSDYMSMSAGRCCTAGSCCSPQLPACCTNGLSRNLIFNPQMNLNNNNSNNNNNNNNNMNALNEDYNFEENKFEYKEPEENFVSIDDIKIKGFLMKIGQQEQRKKEAEEKKVEEARKLTAKQANNKNNKNPAIVYEIIDLDDEEEREKLKRIKNQAEAAAATTKDYMQANQLKNVNEEIMQQVQEQRLKMQQLSRQSPNISLVPAQTKKTNYHKQQQQDKVRIIAQIELLDSSDDEEATAEDYDDEVEPTQDEGNHVFQVMSDDEGNDALVPADDENDDDVDDDDEDIPLAAAAVSCELECDDNDDFDQQQQQQQSKLNANKQKNILCSDDDNDDYVDEHEEGLIVRWDELELEQEQRNCNLTARNIYECFICGKRVQSNYNLRRHMMIHTGK